MRDDHASGDDRLQWLVVTDATGQVVAGDAGRAGRAAARRAREAARTRGVKDGDVVHARSAPAPTGSTARRSSSATTSVGALRIGVSTAGLEAELAKSLAEARDRARKRRSSGCC